MKIIKEPDFEKNIKCNHCRCEFEIETDDIEKKSYAFCGDGREVFSNYVECPLCKQQIILYLGEDEQGGENSDNISR